MEIKEYFKPGSLDEAYDILKNHNARILGGGAFLHLLNADMEAVVDLSGLKLDYIDENDGEIEIGAMTTLKGIEDSELLKCCFDGILPRTAAKIMGVQFRNTATIGGTVSGKYGFSDLLTSLLVLDSTVKTYNHGSIKLEEFLEGSFQDDIVTGITIRKDGRRGFFTCMRNSTTDFSVLNAAASRLGREFRISVGARPYRAKLVWEAMDFISGAELNEENADKAGEIAADAIEFGSDIRGSSEYRKELCRVLIKRCIMGVIQ